MTSVYGYCPRPPRTGCLTLVATEMNDIISVKEDTA